MRSVSSSYNPFARVRNVDFNLQFGVKLSEDIMSDCTVSGSSAYIGSRSAVINNITPIADCYASLEQNCWHLDGKHTVLADNAKTELGYWSSGVSNSSGVFSTPISLTFTFDQDVSTLGWTFVFDPKANECCAELQYQTYNAGGTAIQNGVIKPDGAEYEAREQCEDYRSVKFTFTKTSNPGRRLRVSEIVFGINKHYNRLSVVNLKIDYGASLTAETMPSRKLTFTFDNSDKKYNLLNPDDVFQYLQHGQEITCNCVIDGEIVDMGTFYYNQVTASQSAITPTIDAYDKVVNMEGRKVTGSDSTTTLGSAVRQLTRNYGLSYDFHGNDNTAVVLAFEDGMSVRKALHLLAQAAMCSVWIDRNNTLQMMSVPIKSAPDAVYTGDELYDYSGITLDVETEAVILTVKNSYKEYDDELGHHVGVTNSYATAGADDAEKVKTFTNPCVAPQNGQAVADWLLAMVNRRKVYKVKERCNPAVEIGDTVNIQDAFNNRENAVVAGLEITYDGSLSCEMEAYG